MCNNNLPILETACFVLYYACRTTGNTESLFLGIGEMENISRKGSRYSDGNVKSHLGVVSHCKGEKIKAQIERIFWD